MSDTNFSSGVFEVMSRSNPDYQPVALDVTRDETEHYQQAILRVADTNQTDTILTVRLSVRDLTVLADALEKVVPKSSEKSDDPKDWTEQSAEAWLTAGETTAFIASARLFASVLENNQLS